LMARNAPVAWRDLLLATTCLAAASPLAHGAAALQPTSFSVAVGGGTISTPNATTTIIHQTTDKAIYNWSGFPVSKAGSVAFQQPGSGSISLNRVRRCGAS